MSEPAVLRAEYEAKARAELADADGIVGAPPGTWEGAAVGPRIAFLIGHPATTGKKGTLLDGQTAEALAKAADALGAGADTFTLATRPVRQSSADDRARRVRIALEAIDAPAVIALDAEAAEDLATAFGLSGLKPGTPVRALGRALGSAGDFSASLNDVKAKARVWSAMKAVAARAGLKPKGRQKVSPGSEGTVSD